MQRLALILVFLLSAAPFSLSAMLNDFALDGSKKSDHSKICDHSTRPTKTSLPTLRLVFNPRRVSPDAAIAVIGEIGHRNYRLNGTLGISLDSDQRFKVSAEYLTQQLGYNFTSGQVQKWIHQAAFGAAYEYALNRWCINNLEASFFYAHAGSKSLSVVSCNGNALSIFRRIAGGRDYGFALGGNVFPWRGAKASFYANYDHVVYRRKFSAFKHITGAGVTFAYNQKLFYNMDCDFRFEFRRPFNYYYGLLRWDPSCLKRYGDLRFGIYGSYTKGKSRLPSSRTIGIQVDFSFGVWGVNYNANSTCDPIETCACEYPCAELGDWVTRPAVYMPQVLAIAEERIVDNCTAVPVSNPIPNQTISSAGIFRIDVSGFFIDPTGIVPLRFSATGLPAGTSIDPKTGVITGTNLLDNTTHLVTVTASNPCGSTSQSFTITFTCSGIGPNSTSIPTQIVNANGPYLLQIGSFFSDPTGKNPLTFSAVGLIAGTTINPNTGNITGINPADNSVVTVIVTATNSCGSTSQQFNIVYTCLAPTSQPIPNQTFGGSPTYNFNAGAFFTDVTGTHPLTFSAVGLPAGSTIDPTTGVISGSNPQNGSTVVITVTASNTCGSTSQTFSITFLCIPPTSTPIATQDVPGVTGTAYVVDVSGNFTDPTGVNPLTFSATGLPAGSVIGANNGMITGTIPAGTPVSFSVTVTATNVCGSTSQTFTLNFPG